jgi:hypothetical protein
MPKSADSTAHSDVRHFAVVAATPLGLPFCSSQAAR